MICKNCGNEIPPDALLCPICAAPTGSSPTGAGKKKSGKKKAVIIIASLLIIALVVSGVFIFFSRGKYAVARYYKDSYEGLADISAGNFIYMGKDGYHPVLNEYIVLSYDTPDPIDEWGDIVAVSAGTKYMLGLRTDGTVAVSHLSGEAHAIADHWKNIVALSTCNSYTLGLRADGRVLLYGKDELLEEVESWKRIKAVSAGTNHAVGLRSDGTVVAAGSNRSGECDVDDWKDIVSVAAGNGFTIGLRKDGTVIAAGRDSLGQRDADDWSDITAIAARGSNTIGLHSDGTVVVCGRDNSNYLMKDIRGNNFVAVYAFEGGFLCLDRFNQLHFCSPRYSSGNEPIFKGICRPEY